MGAKYCDHRDSCLYIGIDVSMSVHTRVSQKDVQTPPNSLYVLPLAMVWSVSDDNAI